MLDGRDASVTDGVHQAQRHDPKDFENNAREDCRKRDLEQWSGQCIDSHLLGLNASTVNDRSAASLNLWRTKQEQA